MKNYCAMAFFVSLLLVSNARAQLLKYVCPDVNKEPCVSAKKMIISSQVIVLGDAPKGDDWQYTAEAMLQSKIIGEQKFKQGIKLSEAVEFWKDYAASPFSGDGTPMLVVRRAFIEVYGTYPNQQQNAYWTQEIKNKKAWYTTIVLAEQKKLNNVTETRKKTIDHVYGIAMGRSAKPEEIDYWMKSTNDFRQMFTAARVYLYTDAGSKDLYDVVRRALNFVNKKNPTEAEIKAAIAKYKPGKKVHREMVDGKDLEYGF